MIKIDKADSLYPLWSDEPATQDLLAFRSIAETVVDAIFHSHLNPVAIGLSGTWGSGKTTVLELITQELSKRNTENKGKQVLLVPTQPWRYDPSVGPKESLISDVLGAINAELENRHPESKAWSDAYKKLVKRVNWSKALKLVARTAITAQLPDLASVMSALVPESWTTL